jgi:HD-like signal output (HDOD) protein
MKVKCSKCSKELNIPDERLPMGRKIAFPCPVCKGVIELDLREKAVPDQPLSDEKGRKEKLSGEALKKKILSNVKDLPPMPQTVIKAREIIANPRSDFKDLAALFETDQAIAAKILKLANSPYYGFGGKVSSIQRASVILGHKTLGELISMGGASSILSKRLDGYGLDAGALWKHSLAVAFGSRIIAQKVDPSLLNDAFTSGLIHDTGKLILDKYITERWDEFETFMADSEETFLSAEKAILELDHAQAASEVCKAWNIPKTLTIAIKYHHVPSRSNDSVLAYIVHVADAIAMMTGLGMGVDGSMYKLDDGAMEYLGIKEDAINEIMTEVLSAAQKISTSI